MWENQDNSELTVVSWGDQNESSEISETSPEQRKCDKCCKYISVDDFSLKQLYRDDSTWCKKCVAKKHRATCTEANKNNKYKTKRVQCQRHGKWNCTYCQKPKQSAKHNKKRCKHNNKKGTCQQCEDEQRSQRHAPVAPSPTNQKKIVFQDFDVSSED